MTLEQIQRVLNRAVELGSAAKTVKGALRAWRAALPTLRRQSPLLRRSALSPRRQETRSEYKARRHAERLIRRYAGQKRLPSYLTPQDLSILQESEEVKLYNLLLQVPVYTRAYYPGFERLKEIPGFSREVRRWEKEKGKLVKSPTCAKFAAEHGWYGAHDQRYLRCLGECVEVPKVREQGTYKNWSKKSTFLRFIDYRLVAPRTHGPVYTMCLTTPDHADYKVFRTQKYLKIQGQEPVRVVSSPSPPILPVHSQRRMLEALSDFTVGYDREAKCLTLTDSHGEVYHADPIMGAYSASKVIEKATEAFRRRQAEKRQIARNAELDRILATRPVWVTVEDSLSTGNCSWGTEYFRRQMEEHLSAQGEIGAALASEILALRRDDFTIRAARAAALRLKERTEKERTE